LKGQRY